MIRLFVTGDNHIGRQYSDHNNGKAISEERINAFSAMVEKSNEDDCDFFVITGDLFDGQDTDADAGNITRIISHLSRVKGKVLVLPGNHDYYYADSLLWKSFSNEADKFNNIVLLKKNEEYSFDIRNEKVVFYPAVCDRIHSETNRLQWIKDSDITADEEYRIGVIHGSLEGLSYDSEGKYFPVYETELTDIPMDLWLVGHSHVPYPSDIDEKYKDHGRIYNAGTHVQTDISNRTDGYCFIVELEASSGLKPVKAKKWNSSDLRFFRPETIKIMAGQDLKTVLGKSLEEYRDKSVIDKIRIDGVVSDEDYSSRDDIVREAGRRFIEFIPTVTLSRNITISQIDSEYDADSIPNQLLKSIIDDPVAVQMAYELLKKKEGNK